jgi:hypothetical protein
VSCESVANCNVTCHGECEVTCLNTGNCNVHCQSGALEERGNGKQVCAP